MSKIHARYSPSMLDSLSRCIRFKYSDVDINAASEGTELHYAFETENLNGLDDEQTQSVKAILDLVNSYKATLGGPSMWIDQRERRVTLKGITYGTMDRSLIHKELPLAYAIDAKFTRRSSDHDKQLETYAAALTEELMAEGREIEKVITVVAAPRIGPPLVQEHDAQELVKRVRIEIEMLYEKIEDPFNPPTPHEDLCSKCARASVCPALNAVVKQVAPMMGLPLPSVFDPDSPDITDRDRAIRQVLAGVFDNWSTQVKKANAQYVKESGDPELVPGFRLIRRSSGLRVAQGFTQIAMNAIIMEYGLDQDSVMESCTLALGGLSKKIAEEKGIPEADIKERFKELLVDCTTENFAEYLGKIKRIANSTMLLGLS